LLALGFVTAIFASAGIFAALLYWQPAEWVWNAVMAPVGFAWVIGIFRMNGDWRPEKGGNHVNTI
jgi:hypothetical protein